MRKQCPHWRPTKARTLGSPSLAPGRGGYKDQAEKVSSGSFTDLGGRARGASRSGSYAQHAQAVCPGSVSFLGVLIRRCRVIGAGLSSGAPLVPPRRSRARSSSLGRSLPSPGRCFSLDIFPRSDPLGVRGGLPFVDRERLHSEIKPDRHNRFQCAASDVSPRAAGQERTFVRAAALASRLRKRGWNGE
jgi:hypothetical protein